MPERLCCQCQALIAESMGSVSAADFLAAIDGRLAPSWVRELCPRCATAAWGALDGYTLALDGLLASEIVTAIGAKLRLMLPAVEALAAANPDSLGAKELQALLWVADGWCWVLSKKLPPD